MTSISQPAFPITQPDVGGLLARSALYLEFVAEREEILKHKWVESEKVGRDIGLESALVSWVVHHRAQWQRLRRGERHFSPIPL